MPGCIYIYIFGINNFENSVCSYVEDVSNKMNEHGGISFMIARDTHASEDVRKS